MEVKMALLKGFIGELGKVLKPATCNGAVAVEAISGTVASAAIQAAVAIAPDEKDMQDYNNLTLKLRKMYQERIKDEL